MRHNVRTFKGLDDLSTFKGIFKPSHLHNFFIDVSQKVLSKSTKYTNLITTNSTATDQNDGCDVIKLQLS